MHVTFNARISRGIKGPHMAEQLSMTSLMLSMTSLMLSIAILNLLKTCKNIR